MACDFSIKHLYSAIFTQCSKVVFIMNAIFLIGLHAKRNARRYTICFVWNVRIGKKSLDHFVFQAYLFII